MTLLCVYQHDRKEPRSSTPYAPLFMSRFSAVVMSFLITSYCFGADSGKSPAPATGNEKELQIKSMERFSELKTATHVRIAMLRMHALYLSTPDETDLWSKGCLFETNNPSKIRDLIKIIDDGGVTFAGDRSDFLLPKFGAEFSLDSGRKVKILLSSIAAGNIIYGIFDGWKISTKENVYPKLRGLLKSINANRPCSALDEQE